MAQFTVNATRFDPYKNFKFRVKWDGRYVAGVSKVGALKRTTEVVKHREGGDPSTSRKSPGPHRVRGDHARARRHARPRVRGVGEQGLELRRRPRRRDVAQGLPQGHHHRGLQRGRPDGARVQRLPLLGVGVPGAAGPRRQRERGRDPAHQARERGLGARRGRGRAAASRRSRSAMEALTAAELLDVWEQGASARRARTGRAAARAMPARRRRPARSGRVPLGRRDALLLRLRAATFGRRRWRRSRPARRAARRSTSRWPPRRLVTRRPATPRSACAVGVAGRDDPVSADHDDLIAARDEAVHGWVDREVAAGACSSARLVDGIERRRRRPAAESRRRASRCRVRPEPATSTLELACPACGHEWEAPFDVAVVPLGGGRRVGAAPGCRGRTCSPRPTAGARRVLGLAVRRRLLPRRSRGVTAVSDPPGRLVDRALDADGGLRRGRVARFEAPAAAASACEPSMRTAARLATSSSRQRRAAAGPRAPRLDPRPSVAAPHAGRGGRRPAASGSDRSRRMATSSGRSPGDRHRPPPTAEPGWRRGAGRRPAARSATPAEPARRPASRRHERLARRAPAGAGRASARLPPPRERRRERPATGAAAGTSPLRAGPRRSRPRRACGCEPTTAARGRARSVAPRSPAGSVRAAAALAVADSSPAWLERAGAARPAVVQVSIGRIEVRAVAAPPAAGRARRRPDRRTVARRLPAGDGRARDEQPPRHRGGDRGPRTALLGDRSAPTCRARP